MTELALAVVLTIVGLDAPAPSEVVVATSRGTATVSVENGLGYPVVSAVELSRWLPLTARVDVEWGEVEFARQPFRFLIDAPLFLYRDRIEPLVGGAIARGDTLYVPLQWLSEYLPRYFAEAYRFDPGTARFEEIAATSGTTAAPQSVVRIPTLPPAPPAAAALGLRTRHTVVVDPGHGGRDPGTRGRFLPRGIQEKHVALDISLQLEAELKKRGINVVLTRRTDVLVPFRERARRCLDDCDLFVSIHVNSLQDSPRNRRVRGIETYFFREALTADARRVAEMENESLRYESDPEVVTDSDVGFIIRDLQRNEYLRESAQLAELVHDRVSVAHPAGSRRVAQANFAVLREVRRPGILVETGYGSNREDATFLVSPWGQTKIAEAIADGIVDYLRRYEQKTLVGDSR